MHATPSYHRLIASFPQDVGMAPRAVRSLLQKLGGMANDRSLCMSLYDVTNDGVVDLLEPKPLLVEDSEGAVRAPLPMCVCEEERERENVCLSCSAICMLPEGHLSKTACILNSFLL